MTTDGCAVSSPPPPPPSPLLDDARVHAAAVRCSLHAESPVGAATSLVELHAMPLHAASAPQPLRRKRQSTKRKKPAERQTKRKKRRKRNDEMLQPKRITRKILRGVGMSRKELEEAPQNLEELKRRHVQRLEREERFKRWRASQPDLPPYMKREHPTLPEVECPDAKIVLRVERKIHRDFAKRCQCEGCRWELRGRTKHYQYTCRVFGCKLRFDDVAEFLEHQIDQHAMLAPYCRRVCEDVARHQAEYLLPPLTVYMGTQYLQPAYRPTLWTMERLEHERETLEARLSESFSRFINFSGTSCTTIWRPFLHAYDRVKQLGAQELHEQFKIAMEYYESSLVLPVGPRNRQDVFATIGVGRNWLVSPEPENAERSHLLKVLGAPSSQVEEGKRNNTKHCAQASDEDETDDEIVVYEYNCGAMANMAPSSGQEQVDIHDQASPRKKAVVVASPSRDEMPGDESEPDVVLI